MTSRETYIVNWVWRSGYPKGFGTAVALDDNEARELRQRLLEAQFKSTVFRNPLVEKLGDRKRSKTVGLAWTASTIANALEFDGVHEDVIRSNLGRLKVDTAENGPSRASREVVVTWVRDDNTITEFRADLDPAEHETLKTTLKALETDDANIEEALVFEPVDRPETTGLDAVSAYLAETLDAHEAPPEAVSIVLEGNATPEPVQPSA